MLARMKRLLLGTVLTATVIGCFPSVAVAQSGDLDYDWSCHTSMSGASLDLAIDIYVYAHGGQWDFQTFQGYEEVDAPAEGEVYATEDPFDLECYAYYYYSWGNGWEYFDEDYGVLNFPGAGPREVTVFMESFLPYDWVRKPWDPVEPTEETKADGGDNRGFGFGGAYTYRLLTAFDILNPGIEDVAFGPTAPSHATGLSQEYDAESSLTDYPNMGWLPPAGGYLTQTAKDDWTPGDPYKVRWTNASTSGFGCASPQRLGQQEGVGTSSYEIRCWASASYPFHSSAPPIEWDLTMTIKWGFDKAWMKVTGCHDPFPAYALYGAGTAVFEDGDSGNIFDLFWSCGSTVNRDWVEIDG